MSLCLSITMVCKSILFPFSVLTPKKKVNSFPKVQRVNLSRTGMVICVRRVQQSTFSFSANGQHHHNNSPEDGGVNRRRTQLSSLFSIAFKYDPYKESFCDLCVLNCDSLFGLLTE